MAMLFDIFHKIAKNTGEFLTKKDTDNKSVSFLLFTALPAARPEYSFRSRRCRSRSAHLHAAGSAFRRPRRLRCHVSEQFMVGMFYKRLQNPIEYGLLNEGQDTYYKPMNFGNATNLGVEVDIMKYFNWFGIKANYTYTHSSITTDKRIMEGNDVKSVSQTRPLFGQAAHVANLSLLFKSTKYGWESQLAGSYTGKRLSDISNWYNDDIWEDGYIQLDASVEKSFKNGISIFAKASNLLDTPLLRFIQNGPHTESVNSERKDGNVIERKEWHGQSFMLGIRYKL